MRNVLRLLAGGLAALGLATSASAATLGFDGSLEVEIAGLEPVTLTATGVATVNGSGGTGALTSLALPASLFMAQEFVVLTDPAASPLAAVSIMAQNASGSFTGAGTGSPFGGTMGLSGQALVCIYTSDCDFTNLTVPFTLNGTRGVGIGGGPIDVGAFINVSVTGDVWTVGTTMAFATGTDGIPQPETTTGFAHGPASGSLSSAANTGAAVSLVTPIQINTDLPPSAGLPAFVRLTLTFAPEPGQAVLVGAAIVTLAALGRRRLASQREDRSG
jgi:hypothetical protein